MSEFIEPTGEEVFLALNKAKLLERAVQIAARRYRGPLWGAVKEVTLHGSAYSQRICRFMGWNPDADAKDPLPDVPQHVLDALSTAESRNAEREAAVIEATWKEAQNAVLETIKNYDIFVGNRLKDQILALPCPSPSAIEEEMGETEKKL